MYFLLCILILLIRLNRCYSHAWKDLSRSTEKYSNNLKLALFSMTLHCFTIWGQGGKSRTSDFGSLQLSQTLNNNKIN